MTNLTQLLDKAKTVDLITDEEVNTLRSEINKLQTNKAPNSMQPTFNIVVPSNVNLKNFTTEQILALAVHMGQNESLYMDGAAAAEFSPPMAKESNARHRLRADAAFRVQRALELISAASSLR